MNFYIALNSSFLKHMSEWNLQIKKKRDVIFLLFSTQLPKQWYCVEANTVYCFQTFDILKYIAYIKNLVNEVIKSYF